MFRLEGPRPLFFMPFKSEKQRRYLYAAKPEVAKEFAAKEKKAKAEPKPKRAKKKRP